MSPRPTRLMVALSMAVVMLAGSSPARAQSPAAVPVEGYVTDAGGVPLSGEVTLVASLYDDAIGGVSFFTETHTVTAEGGWLSFELGAVAALDLALFRTHLTPHLGIAIDGDPELAPRLRVATAPFAAYADYAGEAGTLEGLGAGDFRLASDPVPWSEIASAPGVLGDLSCNNGDVAQFNGTSWACVPMPASGAVVAPSDVVRWDDAHRWGDHSTAGYLSSESDPVFGASDAAGISSGDISSWSAAAAWGDHSAAGYLSSESDPVFGASDAAGISSGDISSWNTTAAWGDHGAAGYLSSESDPAFAASPAAGIGGVHIAGWDAAVSWGDHASAGYLTSETDPQVNAAATNALSRWDGGALVDSSVYDNGRVGIGTATPSGELHVRRPDNDVARIYATGDVQGTGMLYAGQSIFNGGGIAYDGDGSPDIVGDPDRVTFFRRAGSDVEVFSYSSFSSTVRFAVIPTFPLTPRYVSIPASGFMPADPGSIQNTGVYVAGTTVGAPVVLRRALVLPHGSDLVGIQVSVFDVSTNDITCSVDLTRNLTNFGPLWTASSSGTTPAVQTLTFSGWYPMNNNPATGFAYTLHCRWTTPNPSGALRLNNAWVTYEVNQPLP